MCCRPVPTGSRPDDLQRLRRRHVQQHDGIERVYPLRPRKCGPFKRSDQLRFVFCRDVSRRDGRNGLQELPRRHLQLVYGLLHLHSVRRREIPIVDWFDDVRQLCDEYVQSSNRSGCVFPL